MRSKKLWLILSLLCIIAAVLYWRLIAYNSKPVVQAPTIKPYVHYSLPEIREIRKAVWMNPYSGGACVPKERPENPVLDERGIKLIENYIAQLYDKSRSVIFENKFVRGNYFYVESESGNFHIFLTPWGATFYDPKNYLEHYTVFDFESRIKGEVAFTELYEYLIKNYSIKVEFK